MSSLQFSHEARQQSAPRQHRSAAGELVGTFDRYNHRWPRDDKVTETIIGKISEELADGSFLTSVIKGTQQLGELKPGLTYRFWGRYTTHDKYGEQFWFESFIELQPVTREAVCLYLAQVDGIGPASADLAWRLWGRDAVEMFRENPEEVSAKLPRFTPEQATAGSELLKKKQRTERGKMDLMELVHRCGVPKRIVDKALELLGVKAAEEIQADPFILMWLFKGIGFLKCDRMYLDFGHDPQSMHRQALACWYSISRDNDGSTWFPRGVAKSFLHKHIAGAKVDFEAAIQYAVDHGILCIQESRQGVFIAEPRKADAENRIARLIEQARLESREYGTAWPDVDQIEDLSGDDNRHQREKLKEALTGVVSFFAGSPGSGKTFCAAALIKTIRNLYPDALVAAAGPTGKSAVRLTESLEKCGVTLAAKTVHSTLGVKSSDEGGFGFQHDQTNPLRLKFLLIDEFSMCDTPLVASLLAARGIGTHYLALGDVNQLAPVGHGAPLRDMLRCPDSIPSGTLTEIRRNSGRIVQACAEIRDRKSWRTSPKLDLDNGENLLLVNAETPAEQIEALERLIRSFRDKPRGERKYDPIWDVQVICAVNKKGELSRKILNELLQGLLNPDGATVDKSPFRVGDKIVCGKNSWLKSANPTVDDCQDGKVYVANGEQAEVIEVEPGVITAKMTSPPRTVLIYRKAKSESQEQAEEAAGGEDAQGDDTSDEAAEGKSTTGCQFELGYAQSGHKCQGSSWKIVIVMLDTDNAARKVCSRQWLYTDISRAEIFCLMIGTKKTADAMCGRDALFARKTFLKERIEELKRETDEAERPREPLDFEPATAFDFDDILEGVL